MPPRTHAVAVAAVAALVLLCNLGGPALWDDDEPKNAACSQAMLDRGDWVVPTFNGRLRVEKPALVNWLHMAGFALAGRTETGARLGSACLTIGTALLTRHLAAALLGAEAGLFAGLAMASCIWTAVGGRSATPDAPLVFFTTLALACRVAALGAARGGRSPRRWMIGCGAALGAATLAKGPVGLCLPLAAFLAHACWEALAARSAASPPAGRLRAGLAELHLPLLGAAAAAVALPWYVAVTVRTGGAWLEGFLVIHNAGRFAAPMEGHAGPALLYYPAVVAVGFFPWSIVLAAVVVHAVALTRAADTPPARAGGVRLALCWLACWVGAFSAAGTKLPGYVWPAYPALAMLTGDFLAAWIAGEARCTARCRFPAVALERVMRLAWSILFAGGLAIAIGLVAAAVAGLPQLFPAAWLGVVPAAGAVAAWHLQGRLERRGAVAALAVTAALSTAGLAAIAADRVGGARHARLLVEDLGPRPARGAWAGFGAVPPSMVFYAADDIPTLVATEDVRAHLASRPDARVLLDSRFEMHLPDPLPAGFAVVARRPQPFGPCLVVVGPRDGAGGRPPSPTDVSPENPLAWHPHTPARPATP